MLLFAEPNKTCILCSMFLMTGTSAGVYIFHTVATSVKGLRTSTLCHKEISSDMYICVTFTCELGTTCDMYSRL